MPDRKAEPVTVGRLKDRAPQTRFEIFLFTAVATVLVVRGYLAATGYPKIGGGDLHVAHVLWGGLLMGAAIVAVAIMPGSRVKLVGAFVGGLGFGLFIDEVGKFLTTSVDYFFRPSVAVMYSVFVGFYLVVAVILRRRRATDERRLATGLGALSDQVLGQLSQSRRDLALLLLGEITDPALRPVAAEVAAALLIDSSGRESRFEHRITALRDGSSRWGKRILGGRAARRIVIGFFVLQAVLSILTLVLALTIGDEQGEAVGVADTAAQISGLVVTAFILIGIGLLISDRYLLALRVLQLAIVIDLLVGEVFLFASEQFGALFGFVISLLMLLVLRITINNEEMARERAALV